MNHDTIIIGGGLAGLTCALELTRGGRNPLILEATDDIGGRVRTDHVDGFRLDRGFQVLLTAYPTCQKYLDYDQLDLRVFEPGAKIRQRGQFRILEDPWRRPSTAYSTLTNPVGTIGDKLRIAKIRAAATRGDLSDLYQRPNVSTLEYLRQSGFSGKMIDEFFRPFIGGVFLDSSLSVSRRMFEFVFRFFSTGDAAVPATGMQAIPNQLADQIGRQRIQCHRSVVRIDGRTVHCSGGETYTADNIVIATESNAASRLLTTFDGATDSESECKFNAAWKQTINLYFELPRDRGGERTLMLSGDEDGPIQTATVISDVAGDYSPAGKTLVSVSLRSGNEGEPTADDFAIPQSLPPVADQLARWLSVPAADLGFIRAYPIRYGLPARSLNPVLLPLTFGDALTAGNGMAANNRNRPPATPIWVAGDHLSTPSIEGAMSTGDRVAAAILANDPAPAN